MRYALSIFLLSNPLIKRYTETAARKAIVYRQRHSHRSCSELSAADKMIALIAGAFFFRLDKSAATSAANDGAE
jgi:hypothetical protein